MPVFIENINSYFNDKTFHFNFSLNLSNFIMCFRHFYYMLAYRAGPYLKFKLLLIISCNWNKIKNKYYEVYTEKPKKKNVNI